MNYSPYQSTAASFKSSSNVQQQYRQQQAIEQRRRMMRQTMNQQRMRGHNRGMSVRQHQMRQRMNQQRMNQQQPSQQQQRRKRPNVLFYSNMCPHSKKFIQALEKNPSIYNTFVHVCVKRGMRLPQCIKVVPTIVVTDSTGRRQILADYRAFEWLNHVIDVPVEISSFQPGLMGTRLSDNYSWIDGSESNEHSFAFIDDLSKHYIYTPPDDSNGQQYDKTTIDFNRLQEARNQDPVCKLRGLAPGSKPDFTQSTITESSKVQKSDFDRALQTRRREIHQLRGPVPKHAPNFTSSQFRSQGFQSNRGGYVPAGEDAVTKTAPIQMRDYKKLVRNVRIPQPSKKPDWRMNLKPMKVL